MGNMIAVDYTIFIQLANFLVTIVVLNYLLIKPVREQIAKRREFSQARTAEIDEFASEAEAKLTAYEAALVDARAIAAAAREQRKGEGRTREQEIIGAAQADAQRQLRASREENARDSKAAMDELLGQVDVFAQKAASRIFG